MTECNVAWPCGREARSALKVFDTAPRFSCSEHEADMLAKGADLRPVALGPWIVPHIEVDGTGRVIGAPAVAPRIAFAVQPFDAGDKRIEVRGPRGLSMWFDFDDVDQVETERAMRAVIGTLNRHFPEGKR